MPPLRARERSRLHGKRFVRLPLFVETNFVHPMQILEVLVTLALLFIAARPGPRPPGAA